MLFCALADKHWRTPPMARDRLGLAGSPLCDLPHVLPLFGLGVPYSLLYAEPERAGLPSRVPTVLGFIFCQQRMSNDPCSD